MTLPTFEALQMFQTEYSIVPIYREIFSDRITPISLLQTLASYSSQYYLLESVEGGKIGQDIHFLALIRFWSFVVKTIKFK